MALLVNATPNCSTTPPYQSCPFLCISSQFHYVSCHSQTTPSLFILVLRFSNTARYESARLGTQPLQHHAKHISSGLLKSFTGPYFSSLNFSFAVPYKSCHHLAFPLHRFAILLHCISLLLHYSSRQHRSYTFLISSIPSPHHAFPLHLNSLAFHILSTT